MKKYTIISLGCPKNLVDSEIFAGNAESAGFVYTEDPASANYIIINTCGFIEDAKQESINTILEATAYKNGATKPELIVTGCLVKRYLKDLKKSLPEVDHFVQLKDFEAFSQILSTKPNYKRVLLTPSHYAYLRISDGCNNFCSYCAIPYIRGRLKSRPIPELVAEAKTLVEEGVKELIITAQDTTLYGTDIYGTAKLVELLSELEKIDKLKWIRLFYLHPAHINSALIDKIASSKKVLNYFEIPFQHINNEILSSMNRKVTRTRIEEIIAEIRTKIPEAVIRTTFIVGYPGEDEEKYNELKEFILTNEFERIGVFTYSQEEDTPAGEMKAQIDSEIAEARKDELMSLQQAISDRILASFVGKKLEAIIEGPAADENFKYEARSYLDGPEIDGKVFLIEGKAEPGEMVKVEIIDNWEYDLIGKIVR
jgi:ribosomal protein S12 methylthiotransferase